MADLWLDGRWFRALTVVDNQSRHSQLIETGCTLTRTKVVAALERVAKRSGYPKMIAVDNYGSECASRPLDAWAYEQGVKLDVIRPGKLVEIPIRKTSEKRLILESLNVGLGQIHGRKPSARLDTFASCDLFRESTVL